MTSDGIQICCIPCLNDIYVAHIPIGQDAGRWPRLLSHLSVKFFSIMKR